MDALQVIDSEGFVVACVASESFQKVQKSFATHKFTVFVVDVSNVVDKATFLHALGGALSSSDVPPAEHWKTWDGAADYAWQALTGQSQNQAVILVSNADALRSLDFPLFIQILEFLILLASDVERARDEGANRSVILRVVLFGGCSDFPIWPNALA